MAAIELVDFKDLQDYVLEELKIPSTDTVTLARIKRNINVIYVNEVAPFKRWPWLIKRTDIIHDKRYVGVLDDPQDTAAVTEGSTTVTLSQAVPIGQGSFAGRFFISTGTLPIYKIAAHTAGTDTLTLATEYIDITDTTANFKIWTDEVDLPTDCRETVDVSHDFKSRMLIPKGLQKLNEVAQVDFRFEDRPKYYSTDDFKDPTTGDGESETDRFRIMRVYPAMFNKKTLLHVTYIQEPIALDVDGDEPFMALEDRIVLAYGALRQSWIRDRNPETADLNNTLFIKKLDDMAARIEDALDMPRLEADDIYMESKRNVARRRDIS